MKIYPVFVLRGEEASFHFACIRVEILGYLVSEGLAL